jgi:L-lactate dehydrogenase (cytochrome)
MTQPPNPSSGADDPPIAPLPKALGLPHGVANIADFRRIARRRLPDFAFDYFAGGIGNESALGRNRRQLDRVVLRQRANGDAAPPDPSTECLGGRWAYPFCVAPVGIPALACPGAEAALAAASRGLGIPFALSSVATAALEAIAATAGTTWFQLYPPRSDATRRDLLDRARAAGVETLMITIDIPGPQWRDRAVRSRLADAARPARVIQAALTHPVWAWRMLRGPRPEMATLTPYVGSPSIAAASAYVGRECVWPIGPEQIARLRDEWQGRLVVKGILDPDSALAMRAVGADGVVVTNHGARQLDAAPSPVNVLGPIRDAVGPEFTLLADSGVENGLDVLRLLRLGADFVMLGKLPYLATAALGTGGAAPVLNMVAQQVRQVMVQLGIRRLDELADIDCTLE